MTNNNKNDAAVLGIWVCCVMQFCKKKEEGTKFKGSTQTCLPLFPPRSEPSLLLFPNDRPEMSKKSPRFLRFEPAPEPRDPRFIDVILLVLLLLFERVWLFRRLGWTSSLRGLLDVDELGESTGPLLDPSMSTSRSWCDGGYANDERNVKASA